MKPRILVVDDDGEMRGFIIRCLKQKLSKKAEFFEAKNGLGASEIFDAALTLVLTDCDMPEMNGLEFIKNIKGMPEYEDVPIIMLSGRDTESDSEAAFTSGANGFLAKPFTAETLLMKIKEVVPDL